MEKSFLPPSNGINSSVNTIEASIEMVRKKRRRKRRCNAPAANPISSPKSGRISLSSTVKSTVSISKSSCIKIVSAPELTHRKKRTASITSTIGKTVPAKYSSLLFSANSTTTGPEMPMFNRSQDDVDSLASEAVLSATFLSEYENRLNSTQVNLQSEVDKEWEALSQQISPRQSDHEQHISEMEIQYQSEVTFNQVFHSPVLESNFELSSSDYHNLGTCNKSCDFRDNDNDNRDSVNDRIVSLSRLTEQNHQIASQLQELQSYVREKMEASDDYVRTKLARIEEAYWALVQTVNQRNRVESDGTNRKQQVCEPVRSQRDVEPVRSQRGAENVRSQRDIEPVRSQRDIEPVRSQRGVENVRSQRDIEPIRSQRDKRPIRSQCNQIEQDKELIRTQRDKVPNRIERDNDKAVEARQVKDVINAQPAKQPTGTKELVMPRIPILRDFNLVILNIALKNDDYMKQFVSEVSRVVTLNAYNCRNSVRSVINELFSINLLGKYRWSTRTFSSINKPTFSSFTNILKAIARVLTNYMSEHDVRREVKAFFKEML